MSILTLGDSLPTRPSKVLKPKLRSGVSFDSPKSFQLNHVPLLSPSNKASELFKGTKLSLKDYFPSGFSEVTQNKPTLTYQDSKSGNFDFNTLKLAQSVDFAAETRPLIRARSGFHTEYINKLNSGFGRTRGICTANSNQAKITRTNFSKLNSLDRKVKTKYFTSQSNTYSTPLGTLNSIQKKASENIRFKGAKTSMERFLRTSQKQTFSKKASKRPESGRSEIKEFEERIKTKTFKIKLN